MRGVAGIQRRLRDERGFTLIELLTTMAIGMVVLLAVISLTEVGARSASRTSDRADATQRSRLAMTFITQGLRNQVCPSATKPPIQLATKDTTTGVEQLTYYADPTVLDAAAPQPQTFAPEKRRLTFDPRSGGSIKEEVWDAKRKTNPPFPAAEVGEPELLTDPAADPKFQYPGPVRQRTLLRGVTKVSNRDGTTTDFLRYYGFDGSLMTMTSGTPQSLSTTTTPPLPDNSVAKVVRIAVSFTAEPESGNAETERDSDMQTSVYLRNSDYTNQEAASIQRTWGPRCD